MNKIAIIMRSKNSEHTIAAVLKSLYSQSIKDFELHIIDSGSTDKTLDIARNFPCEIREIPAGDYFPGKVLNNAIEKTNAETIVFLNSDCVLLTPYALENLVENLSELHVVAAYSRQLPYPNAKTWVKRDYSVSFPESEPAPWMIMSLPFACIKKSIWKEHNFYTQAYGSEDTEWGFWALNNGFQINYEPRAIVAHSHNYSLKELYSRRYIEGEADRVIFGKRFGIFSFLTQWIKSTIRDIPLHLQEKDFPGLLTLPIVRFVYHFGYLRGNKPSSKAS